MMRKQAASQLPRGIELATVIGISPLRIRIDNMDIHLEGDDLIVCEHLLSKTGPGGADNHTHDIMVLAVGDRLAVRALPGEQQYLVIDKVVVMSG